MTGPRPRILSLLTFLAVLGTGLAFVNLAARAGYESRRREARDAVVERARAIEGEVQQILAALYPIAASLDREGQTGALQRLVPTLLSKHSSVVGVVLAPGGVVVEMQPSSVFPEVGQDLKVDPRLGPAVTRALGQGEPAMTGPFAQGHRGVGVALCLPLIASRDGVATAKGVLLATVEVRELLRNSDADSLTSSGLQYHLTAQVDSGRSLVLARSTEDDLLQPVSAEVRVPDGAWTLLAAPPSGWDRGRQIVSQAALVFVLALVAALAVLRLVREPDQLREEVEKRRRRLSDTRRQLEEESGKRQEVEELREREARHDRLTGLQSRGYFVEQVQRALDRVPFEPGSSFAVLFVDIDHFRRINDALGPAAGDAVLVELARRIERGLRLPGDTLGRLGGDQFAALLWNIHNETGAGAACERLLGDIRHPYDLGSEGITVGASAGLAIASPRHQRGEDLIRDAEIAMSVARAQGRGGWALFAPKMLEQALALQRLEVDLRRAVEREEFEVHYQPIVSLDGGELIGAEALVRWRHPTRGLVSPLEFIPFAESSGLIVRIDQLVFVAAAGQARAWQREFPEHAAFSISVNLSAQQLSQPGLVDFVASVLSSSGLPARSLKLEVTESGVMENPESAREILRRLKDLGAQLLIDDFGTGYSSLGYLERFAFDIVKIDQTFVRNLEKSPRNRDIIRAVVELSRSLNLRVLAEGVETAAHLEVVRQLGCHFAQGYFFSKPRPATAFKDLLSHRPPWQSMPPYGQPPLG